MTSLEVRLGDCLSKAIPGFEKILSVRRLSGGASQATYRVETETSRGPRTLAVRRSVRGGSQTESSAGPGLAGEAELFRIAKAAGVPEPEVLHVFSEAEDLGEGFVMEWLEGETVGSRILRASELDAIRPNLAFQCGEILARIHGIDVATHRLGRFLETVSTRSYVEAVWERYRSLGTPLPMIDYTARWLLDHLPDEVEPRLVHDDFRNGNLLVSPAGIVGVLDWELAHLGDPIRDLGWICTPSWRFGRHDRPVGGFGFLSELLDGYESVSGTRVDTRHVRFWQIFGSFWWAASSLAMAAFWREGADRTVERPAIARRSSECQVDCANEIIPGPVALVAPESPHSSVDLPSVDELLTSVCEFLRGDARRALEGRDAFLALVGSNALDIVQRELALGPAHRRGEHERLRILLASDAPLEALRASLCAGLREGSIALGHPGLADHLRNTAANQLAIDQPQYPGLATALDFTAPDPAGRGDPSPADPHEEDA